MEKISWGTLVPRMGGGAIGCFQATGAKPLFTLSCDGFWDNDMGLANYWPDVPYYVIDKGQLPPKEDLEDIDFIMTVCPYGGMSMQNNVKRKITIEKDEDYDLALFSGDDSAVDEE